MELIEYNKSLMKKYKISAQKKFGQNFLINESVLDEIITTAQVSDNDVVIEIGPGLGNLTKKLCENAYKVIAIEIDTNMVEILSQEYVELDNLQIINQDVMQTDLSEIINKYEDKNVKVIANLPYYITTPIVMKLLEDGLNIKLIEIMVQKEVAKRFCATPNGKEYGAITVAINYYTIPTYLFDVPACNFLPAPEVDSAVVRLDIAKKEIKNEKLMFEIVKAAFSQRRKTLLNSLGSASINGVGKAELTNILNELGFDLNIRAERLSLEDFIKLADIYKAYK